MCNLLWQVKGVAVLEIGPDHLDANMLKRTLVLHHEPEKEPRTAPATPFQALGTARVDEFAPVRVGHKLDGYEIKENLAEGGMGAVFRVKDRAGEGELALKAPLPDGRGALRAS